jgi:hypothetical protein
MFGNRYQRKLESTLNGVVSVLGSQLNERAPDKRDGEFLQAIMWVQAQTLCDFTVHQRRDTSMREFADAMLEPESALRALHVAIWALLARIPSSALAHRYPHGGDAAMLALGIDNTWEERLVDYESTSEIRELLEAPFDRLRGGHDRRQHRRRDARRRATRR